MAGSGIDPSRSSIVLKLSADKLLFFKWSQAQVHYFFNLYEISSFMCRTIKILISNWPRKRKFSQLLKAGKTVASDFAHQGHALVTLYVQFYALIGQNLTGEFKRKIYASSLNLFTLTAEADGVLCQRVMFLTAFLHWMYKMKYSCYQESSVIHEWFLYWVFGWEMRRLSKSKILFRMASFLFSTLLDAQEGLERFWPYFQELHLEWKTWEIIVSDVCLFFVLLFHEVLLFHVF